MYDRFPREPARFEPRDHYQDEELSSIHGPVRMLVLVLLTMVLVGAHLLANLLGSLIEIPSRPLFGIFALAIAIYATMGDD